MAEKPTTTEFNSNFPVAGWSRNTVADGKWLNNNTIEPLKNRDTELLNLINDNAIESEEADINLAEGLNNLKEEIETTFELSAGNNISLVEDPTGKILTINAADTPVDNFVTSAKDVISQDGLAYFLIKDGESSKWDGIDLSAKFAEKVDKDEFDNVVDQIEETFVDLSATVDRDYVKKGEIPDPVFYDISASYANAYSGTYEDKDYYFVEGAKIKGKDGLSAEYDEVKNEWEIGLETAGLSYLYDNYTNNGIAVTSGDVIKFNTSHSQDIDIDSDGNIEIPETVNKFTININEFIEGNIPDVHNFLLNKLSLYSGDSKIISTQNYYNAEVGSSNATIALTIDNTSYSTHTYTLKYEGSDIAATAQLNITISILEEVTCLSEINDIDVDNTWAHFKNDGTWYNINSTTYTDVSDGLSLAEGELISSIGATLPVGLYFFSAELAYHSYTPEDTYQKIDLKLMYGDTELRAESFTFDKAAPNGVFQTEWSSGLFKLDNSGSIAIKLALGSSTFTSYYDNQVKVSHFFIRKIDDTAIGSGSGSGDNDKVAVDANTTAGYLEDILVSDSDLVSLIKSGNTLRVNVNTDYSSDPKLSTMNESQIDSATSNYGSYALQDGVDKLVWDDTEFASYQWLNAAVYQMMRLSDAQGTITKCNLALCGSLSFSDPVPCFNVGIFDTNGTLLGQTGLKFYGTDFNSDEELCTVDMIESSEGSLSVARNTRYIVMLWSCGLQIAGLDKSTNYNYVYDLNLRQNLQGTISSPTWPAISDISTRSSVIPYISFGAQQLM